MLELLVVCVQMSRRRDSRNHRLLRVAYFLDGVGGDFNRTLLPVRRRLRADFIGHRFERGQACGSRLGVVRIELRVALAHPRPIGEGLRRMSCRPPHADGEISHRLDEGLQRLDIDCVGWCRRRLTARTGARGAPICHQGLARLLQRAPQCKDMRVARCLGMRFRVTDFGTQVRMLQIRKDVAIERCGVARIETLLGRHERQRYRHGNGWRMCRGHLPDSRNECLRFAADFRSQRLPLRRLPVGNDIIDVLQRLRRLRLTAVETGAGIGDRRNLGAQPRHCLVERLLRSTCRTRRTTGLRRVTARGGHPRRRLLDVREITQRGRSAGPRVRAERRVPIESTRAVLRYAAECAFDLRTQCLAHPLHYTDVGLRCARQCRRRRGCLLQAGKFATLARRLSGRRGWRICLAGHRL
ncbi:hypothetical protein [Ralstonia sp. Ralssp110]|uniref:hypothetical protein n=1 Tax=Ralstonia sp. Ralssp110 TaxID=3243004 RepID=UPI0039B4C15E